MKKEDNKQDFETTTIVRLSNVVDINKLVDDPILWDAVKYIVKFCNQYGLDGKEIKNLHVFVNNREPFDPTDASFGLSTFVGVFKPPKNYD